MHSSAELQPARSLPKMKNTRETKGRQARGSCPRARRVHHAHKNAFTTSPLSAYTGLVTQRTFIKRTHCLNSSPMSPYNDMVDMMHHCPQHHPRHQVVRGRKGWEGGSRG